MNRDKILEPLLFELGKPGRVNDYLPELDCA